MWNINNLEDFYPDVLVVKDSNYILITWGSLLQERFYRENGNELHRELLSLEEAKAKFPDNEYLKSLNDEKDLPDYGNDFF